MRYPHNPLNSLPKKLQNVYKDDLSMNLCFDAVFHPQNEKQYNQTTNNNKSKIHFTPTKINLMGNLESSLMGIRSYLYFQLTVPIKHVNVTFIIKYKHFIDL